MSFPADDLTKHAASLRALARDLLADDGLADDAVQQACVTALTRPPAGPVVVVAWLRAVVRSCALDLWRAEQRRRRRERRAARAAAGETPDAAEQLELQQDIVAAVRSLEEPYRTAIWLRYYEHRSPAAIAQALGEPIKTVKTRLWRALQLLRQKLDRRYGERRAWFTALAPLSQTADTVQGVAGIAGGGLLMHGKSLVVAGVLLVLVITGGTLWWPRDATAVPLTSPSPPDLGEGRVRGEQAAAGAEPIRQAAAAAEPTSPFGSLLVRVRWHDRTPAPDVAVDCLFGGEPQLDRNELRLVADRNGIARALRVRAGSVRLTSDRGGTVETRVVGGGICDVDFVLPRGLDVAGSVRDEYERPVAGARVVLVSPRSGWLGGRVVARSDGAGAFAVRAVDPGWSLGARAVGYAPSRLVDLEDVAKPQEAAPVRVQLQLLLPGATVTGRVVDESGAAIAGALVVLGRGIGGHYEPSRVRESWSPDLAESGEDGSFRCDGVEPGEQPIAARAEGCTRAVATVTCVAGATASITLVVARGFVVRGTVRDEAGAAIADATVTTLESDGSEDALESALRERREVKRPRTRSDADGRYELRSVPAGKVEVIAATQSGDFERVEGACQATLSAHTGDELTWDPVLRAGKMLRVRLVDEHGKPFFHGAPLLAYAEQPAGFATVRTTFLERQHPGLYVFTQCADVPYTVAARVDSASDGTHWMYLRGARPGGPDLELRMPTAPRLEPGEVVGRIVDRGNRLAGKALTVSLCTNATRKPADVHDGRFRAQGLRPGRYFVWAKADDDPILVGPPFELQPGQTLDLGELATEPGVTLRVSLRAPDAGEVSKPAAILDEGFERRRMQWDGSSFVAANLTAGRHRVKLQTPGWHAPPRDLDLAAGRDHVVTLDVAPAAFRRFRFTMPWPDQWQRCELALRDAAGNLVSANSTTSAGVGIAPHWWRGEQPFGQFTLEAVIDGRRRTWPIDLRDGTGAEQPLSFSLR